MPVSRWILRRRREPHIDPMGQSERTAMAWQRTALGVGGIGAALLHSGVAVTAVMGAVALAAALGLLFFTERRYEHLMARVEQGEPPSSPALMRAMTGMVLVLALGALALIVLPRG